MIPFGIGYPPIARVHSFPVGSTLATLGDSISAVNSSGTATTAQKNALGFAAWACVLSRQRVVHTHALNFGVAGETSSQVLARVGQVVAARPNICTVLAGTNDGAISGGSATTIANLDAIYSALTGAGILVIAIPITPRGSGTTAERQRMLRVNDWIKRRSGRNFIVLDLTENFGHSAWVPKAGYTYDNLHPTPVGAFQIGKALAALVTALIPSAPAPGVTTLDTYDAVNNPSGNLLPNGVMAGTGGGLATGFTGQLANNHFINGTPAMQSTSVVFSKSTFADGIRAAQRVVWSGTYASALGFQIASNSTPAWASAGDVLEATIEVEVAAGSNAHFSFFDYTAWSSGYGGGTDLAISATNASPTEGWSGILKTPPITVPAALTTLSIGLQFTAVGTSGTAQLDMTFGAARLSKVL